MQAQSPSERISKSPPSALSAQNLAHPQVPLGATWVRGKKRRTTPMGSATMIRARHTMFDLQHGLSLLEDSAEELLLGPWLCDDGAGVD